ncbi:hypothetical protein ACFWMH_38320 [Streptomyces tendae]|uniref:AMP-binding enzyme n=1 Tax=Streptomyces tendae TaxID=1932 RepID=UPI0036697519
MVICPPDKERGEEICAVVVPAVTTGDVPSDAREPTAWARERLGRDKYPRRIEVLPSLPVATKSSSVNCARSSFPQAVTT